MQSLQMATARADDWRICLDRPRDVRFWTATLEVTEQELREAIAAVGPMAPEAMRFIHDRRMARRTAPF